MNDILRVWMDRGHLSLDTRVVLVISHINNFMQYVVATARTSFENVNLHLCINFADIMSQLACKI